MQKSRFIISLDFELFWGVRDKRTIESYGKNILGVRKVIPALLDLFDANEINATFATVGFLFAKDKEELLSYIPPDIPQYSQGKYSPYENSYLDSVGKNEKEDPYHFAGSLIQLILQQGNQEIATHSFSHYYCLENASLSSFEADIRAARAIASSSGIELKSIVFPRNQYSEAHISICRNLGIIAYRGNEKSMLYQPRQNEEQNKIIRALRLADSYVNLTGSHSFVHSNEKGIVNIPASRFLRPYSSRLKNFDKLKVQRIQNSMDDAARNGTSFHLWWHPHNFGIHLEENMYLLKQVIQHYKKLQQSHGMESRTMKYIAEETLAQHAV